MQLGEFVYRISMSATPAPAITLPTMLADLGSHKRKLLEVPNPMPFPVHVTASCGDKSSPSFRLVCVWDGPGHMYPVCDRIFGDFRAKHYHIYTLCINMVLVNPICVHAHACMRVCLLPLKPTYCASRHQAEDCELACASCVHWRLVPYLWQVVIHIGLARTLYIRCVYSNFGRKIYKCRVI
jgi:hypothetical protein